MSHGILENDQMFSVKERPWHGLGTVVQDAPSIDEAIRLANLGWEVELQDVQTVNGLPIPDRKVTVRKDTQEVLGYVGRQYKIAQNKDAFEIFRPFVEDDLISMETAGSLFNGRKVFILAKLKHFDNLVIGKDDVVEKYILFSNSHDGSSAVQVGFCNIRVVCNNTLNFALSAKASQLIKVYHKGKVDESIKELMESMDMINADFKVTDEKYQYLASKTNIRKDDLENYVRKVFSKSSLESIIRAYDSKLQEEQIEKEEEEKARKQLIKRIEEIWEPVPVKSAWTLYNSVNSYLNHNKSKELDQKYQGIWFRDAKKTDIKALNIATKMF